MRKIRALKKTEKSKSRIKQVPEERRAEALKEKKVKH
jgi:hypothetical protein